MRGSQIEGVEENLSQEQINDEDDQGGLNESSNGSAADALGAAFDAEPLITTDGGDDESENDGLGDANAEVTQHQHIDGTRPELLRTEVECKMCDQESAKQSR